jgi:ribosome-associated protein
MTVEAEAPRPLRLDHFLKREQLTESGGEAKHAIQSGLVQVNGVVETRRKRKLKVGDVVLFEGKERTVASE